MSRMSWQYTCLPMHKGCLLIYITPRLVCSPKDHYSQCPDVTGNFALEFLMYRWQNIMFPANYQHSTVSLTFRHIPHSVTMLELLYWLSSVTDLSVLDLEQTFFQQEILLPLVPHPLFFVSRELLSVLIIKWPRGQTSINLS